MGNYVPNYKHDVFLSYAHVDDVEMDKPPGWVTTFWKHMKTRLGQRLGRADAFNIWMDHDLEYSGGVTPQLMSILDDSAILMVILSPGYARSVWCERERSKFLDNVSTRTGPRVIVVERERFEDSGSQDRELVPDKKKFEFWTTDETGRHRILGPPARLEQAYWDLVDDVSYELVKALDRLREEEERSSGSTKAGVAADAPTVYLAHVNHDMQEVRSSVKRYLEQLDFEVLPTGHYSKERDIFTDLATRDIAKSQLFVQLYGKTAWQEPEDLPGGFYRLQADLADEAGIASLCWRSPDLDLDEEIRDANYLDLVDSAAVRAEPLDDLKSEIVKLIGQGAEEESTISDATKVFLCADQADREIADDLSAVLSDFGAECSLPIETDDPGEYRKDVESNLQGCDGLIVVFGDSPSTWVQQQLKQCRRARLTRDSRLDWAVYEAFPHPDDEPIGDFKGLKKFAGGSGFNEEALSAFVQGLRA